MKEQERLRFLRMPRGEFIHFAKDFLLLTFERDSAGELAVITSLVLEEADTRQRFNLRLTFETLYDDWKAKWQPKL
jgi:hypothetical protein